MSWLILSLSFILTLSILVLLVNYFSLGSRSSSPMIFNSTNYCFMI